MSTLTDDRTESNYQGSALMRLLSYMKPYMGRVILCLILVLALTFFDLYRPTLIGDAIDLFKLGLRRAEHAVERPEAV